MTTGTKPLGGPTETTPRTTTRQTTTGRRQLISAPRPLGGAAGVLFEPPGERGRRRRGIASAAASAVVALCVAVVLIQLTRHGQLDWERWQPLSQVSIQRFIFSALGNTVLAGVVSIAIGLPVGAVMGLLRLSRRRLVSVPSGAVVELLRSLPLLFVVYFFLLALPALGLRLPPFWQLVIPIVLHSIGNFAEIFRAGVLALPRGQSEAGYAIGLRHGQVMRLIVLPQAVRALLPTIIGQAVRALKDTTLGYVVSYPELMHQGNVLGSYLENDFLQVYFEVAVIFVVMNWLLSRLAEWVESRTAGRTSAPDRSTVTARRTAALR
ncbi:amino acid ABC transporter permease [Streptomyces sp. SID10853]|uniref:ABC transporter permease subunit n=1 Tax=Streptomyces sp. SID10853 TaxID=2706028 RepID=UPI0013C14611|nr:amino acid ABC transporter permease [Streptomyces sp. SID10853]